MTTVENKLKRYFFNNSLNFYLEEEEISGLNLEKQEAFLNATVKSELLQKYPVSQEFCRLFFKRLISLLESHQEVHDEFYIFLCDIIGKTKPDDFYYKHYLIGSNIQDFITIKETKNLIVNGTTGLRTWQAALMLADFGISHRSEFNQKNVLELGAGIGFTGITIAKFCDIKSILLTDCHDNVLQTLINNVEINFSDFRRMENGANTIFKIENKTVGVTTLDWNYSHHIPSDFTPDVIIGADIIYDPSLLTPLCRVLKTLFNRNKNIIVYFVNIIRNEETHMKFLDALDAADLTADCIPYTEKALIEWDSTTNHCFLKIKMKL